MYRILVHKYRAKKQGVRGAGGWGGEEEELKTCLTTRLCYATNLFYYKRETETDRQNERTIFFFINEGNGIRTILFFIQPSGKKKKKKKRERKKKKKKAKQNTNNKNNRKLNNYQLKNS